MSTLSLAAHRVISALASTALVQFALASVILLQAGSVLAGQEALDSSGKVASASPDLSARSLADRIDRILTASWAAEKVEPAPAADDAEFLRRIFLDLAGKIPSAGEARAFLDDPNPDKRHTLIEHLLSRATFPAHFGRTLRDLMVPGATNNLQLQILIPQFESWLRLRLTDDTSYDKIVAELLTFTTPANMNPRANPLGGEPSPALFYLFNERKPENLAASTARLFLGIQVECAQCHNHPFARWKREEFWSFTAFFGGIDSGQPQNIFAAVQERSTRQGIKIPGSETTVEPRLLDGTNPNWSTGDTNRAMLARWVTAGENPFFARATVNRIWAHFFGRGLVDPVDDLDESNPPSHPEILDELARQFGYHKFDFKFLIRAITTTRAYQLSSQTTHASQDDPRHFARMPLRSMTADQLFDSLAQATGLEQQPISPRGADAVRLNSPKAAFQSKFTDPGISRTEYQATILQALTLMNGQIVSDATSLSRSENLQAILEAPFLDSAGRIESLFLATLTRRPTTAELAKMQHYIDRTDSEFARKQALSDVFWALLNSVEFVLNH